MSCAQDVADFAADKRRQNPNYQPSMAELKAIDEVLIAQARSRLFTVELTEAQLLHAWCQAEHALAQTFKDIERGRCTKADAIVERELYSVLSKAVYARPREPLAAKGGAA